MMREAWFRILLSALAYAALLALAHAAVLMGV